MLDPWDRKLSLTNRLEETTQFETVSPRASTTPEHQKSPEILSSKKSDVFSEQIEQTSISSTLNDHKDNEFKQIQKPEAMVAKEVAISSKTSSAKSLLPSIEPANKIVSHIPKDFINTEALPPRAILLSTRRSSRVQSSGPATAKEVEPDDLQQEAKRPAPRTLRKRKREPPSVEDLLRPLTEEERQNWAGWAEIESEPALFNHILRGHGVKDVKIKELFGVSDDFTSMLPNPVHGIIFLFKYRENEDETMALPKCPSSIWFANQIASNSCATVAMLNILMNIPDIDLGPALSAFKAATTNKKPPYRGRDLKNNAAIRVVHNSFVRRIEILNADLYLQNEHEKWQKQIKAQASSKKRKTIVQKKKTAKQQNQEDEDAAFHFIAYVPIGDEVWRMDGMQRNPINLGKYDGSWLPLARENIQIQMAMHPDDEEYNFMAICRSPLSNLRTTLASNAHAIQSIESKLTSINADWRAFLSSPPSPFSPSHSSSPAQTYSVRSSHQPDQNTPSPPRELSDAYGLTPSMVLSTPLTPAVAYKMDRAGTDMEALMMLRAKLILEEQRLQREHCKEVMDDSDEAETAQMYMVDYGPDMYRLVRELLDSGELKKIWDDL